MLGFLEGDDPLSRLEIRLVGRLRVASPGTVREVSPNREALDGMGDKGPRLFRIRRRRTLAIRLATIARELSLAN